MYKAHVSPGFGKQNMPKAATLRGL